MRVVLTGVYKTNGMKTGPESVAISIFNEMQKHTETVFVTKYSILKPHSVWDKFFGLIKDGNIYYCGFLRMPFLISKLNPDILHGINFDPFVGFLFALAQKSNYKKIYTVHGIIKYEHTLKKRQGYIFKFKTEYFEKLIFKYSDSIVFYNSTVKEWAKKYFQEKNFSIKFTSNSVSSQFQEYEGFFRKEKDFSEKTIRFIAMGGWPGRARGIEFFFDALMGVTLDFELFYLGEKEEFIVPPNLRGKVKCIGKLSFDKYLKLLHDCQIYLCLSYYESMPVTAIEAMQAGLVVIAFDGTGISDYLKNSFNGFVVGKYHPDELRKTLQLIHSDKMFLQGISTSAKKISEKLAWKKTVLNYFEIYESALDR